MTDRELLELAALAAGYGEPWTIPEYDAFYIGPKYKPGDQIAYKSWNPLTDDGDALRLAVRLGLVVGSGASVFVYDTDLMAAWAARDGSNEMEGYSQERYSRSSGDALASIRRAIVRAAAEIGRSMKATKE